MANAGLVGPTSPPGPSTLRQAQGSGPFPLSASGEGVPERSEGGGEVHREQRGDEEVTLCLESG